MRRNLVLFLFLFSFTSYATNFCPNVYFSGWYCDGGDAVHCAYDYYYDEYYEDSYIDCNSMPNAWGCFAGSCSCIYSCAHGIQNRDCSCTCSYPWSGSRCQDCVRQNYECNNGGTIDRSSCQCNCANACKNGGTADSSCSCSCKAPWSGPRCETCTRSSSECANGGTIDPQTCQCVCPTACQNGGSRDANCNCACPSPWQGPTCASCGLNQGNCALNSTLNSNLCQCNCVTPCQNSGTLTRTCDCNCGYPWVGATCETCSIASGHCLNNSTFVPGACKCDCTGATTCKHNGRVMSDFSCGCDCVNGWAGEDCSTCGRDSAFCLRGGTFQASTCDCNCGAATCVNGKLNERCQCICNNGFAGDDCAKASSAGSLAPSIAVGIGALLLGVALGGN